MSHVYLPTTAIVSLLYVMEDGASADIAAVGNESVVGISLFTVGESTLRMGIAQYTSVILSTTLCTPGLPHADSVA